MSAHATFIVDAIRTPRGRGNNRGALAGITPVELLAQQMRALLQRNPIDSTWITDTVIGCVGQTGEQGSNIGKMAALAAGWSDAVPALTVNRFCASGLSAVLFAAREAQVNDGLAVGGGVEMMSRVALGADQGPLTHDATLQQAAQLVPIGLAADTVATLEKFTRDQCDAYALASQQRAAQALALGGFRSIVPVYGADGATLLDSDETPRESTTAQSLARAPAAFATLGASGLDAFLCQRYGLPHIDHVHHAGNAPATADGASLVLLASAAAVHRHGLRPRARILASATLAVDRTLALTGAVNASQLALQRAGLGVADMGVFEVNESFAALMLHYMRHLGVRHEQLNVQGGTIALGHAMGSTGSALISCALDALELRAQRYALVALCGAAGLAVAVVIERLA